MPWRGAWQPTPVFLCGESPWTEEPGGLQSIWLQSWTWLKWFSTHIHRHTHTPTHTHPCSRHCISTDNALVSNLYMDHDQRAWVGQIYQNHPTNKWLISLILFLFYSHMTNYNQSYAYKYLRKTKNYMTGETYIIQYSSLFCPLPSYLVERSQPDLYSFFFPGLYSLRQLCEPLWNTKLEVSIHLY